MGVLAHEFGHLSNRDSQISLIIGGANIFITLFFLIIKVISLIIKVICYIFAIFFSKSNISSIVSVIIGAIQSGIVALWIKISMIFVKSSMRATEYEADKYACQLGYHRELVSVLDKICIDIPSQNRILRILNSTHPNHNDRIARIQQYYGV